MAPLPSTKGKSRSAPYRKMFTRLHNPKDHGNALVLTPVIPVVSANPAVGSIIPAQRKTLRLDGSYKSD